MGTPRQQRELLYKTLADSKAYAVISPQMGGGISCSHGNYGRTISGYNLQVNSLHSDLMRLSIFFWFDSFASAGPCASNVYVRY
ncbi:4-hydroxy-tetrahydrodipicolinate reductase [Handroanthus impetiginosus]|uniref:4-hydroxy-tetrahydrodipicolinate reductase n=1 Tax=Handroanthus impetiginosus TaxID=429701 RepID=A0A2G9G797_9LAMI|nr:4-hydroxy-tetrahydrodipicolinate reductase [Handroanthus impetiginosus]